MSKKQRVRVRFAPSPTGPLHIGGIRTALYNYLFAKRTGGDFVLRIEDTDHKRRVAGAEAYIYEALDWCGIRVDEGPQQGGACGPYRQSERGAVYSKYIKVLLEQGRAYYAFDTPAALATMRTRLQKEKADCQHYGPSTRMAMENSLTLSPHAVEKRRATQAYVIRLKVAPDEPVEVSDALRGSFSVPGHAVEDKVLMKGDGTPTYHFAHLVDDHEMGITHVLRGAEWLSSLPIHMLLHRYLGWADEMPIYGHLPLILKPSGKGKLSKRDAEQHTFPIYPLPWDRGQITDSFKGAGYLPEALCNFLALLGWQPRALAEEVLDVETMARAFSWEDLSKAGVRWDIKKALWFNEQYIRKKSPAELGRLLVEHHPDDCYTRAPEALEKICEMMRERVQRLPDIMRASIFLKEDLAEKAQKERWFGGLYDGVLRAFAEVLTQEGKTTPHREASGHKEHYVAMLKAEGKKVGEGMRALRQCLTGTDKGPDLVKIMAYLGSEKVSERIASYLAAGNA